MGAATNCPSAPTANERPNAMNRAQDWANLIVSDTVAPRCPMRWAHTLTALALRYQTDSLKALVPFSRCTQPSQPNSVK